MRAHVPLLTMKPSCILKVLPVPSTGASVGESREGTTCYGKSEREDVLKAYPVVGCVVFTSKLGSLGALVLKHVHHDAGPVEAPHEHIALLVLQAHAAHISMRVENPHGDAELC